MSTKTDDWEKEFDKKFGNHYPLNLNPEVGQSSIQMNIKDFITQLLTSRDTYWKERVEEIYGHFSWCQECAEGPMCKDALAIKDNLK